MRKLSLSLIIVVVASIFGLGWLINTIYDHSSAEMEESAQLAQLDILHSMAIAVEEMENPLTFIEAWNKNSLTPINLFKLDDLPFPEPLSELMNTGQAVLLESENGVEAYILLKDSGQILSLLMTIPEEENRSRLELLLTLSFYAGITTIILIWVWPLVHNLESLRKTALRFGQGDLSARANVKKLSYINDIENEFNRMADKIQSLISDNKLLSRAVSHDLKTPLARLRFGLDALSETDCQTLKEKYAKRVDRDLEDMESLIETLLQYARLDDAKVSLQKKPLNIAELVNTLCHKQQNNGIDVSFELLPDHANIAADSRYLSMLFNNILSNATRHASSKVTINIEQDHREIRLIVEDDGPGIPKAERSDAIKPFWRGNASRDQKGHGMGLAIVARIAEWHQAELDIDQSAALGGAKVTLAFDKEAV